MSRLLFTLLVLAGVLCARADATAFAGVQVAFWQADFAYYYDPVTNSPLDSLPAGVTVSCTGTAFADGLGGCMDKRGTQVSSSSGAFVANVVNALGGYELHNTSGADYNGAFVFDVAFSSFNPGGPEIGASVDNPGKEYASFFSVVQGPGAFDLHGCDMHHGASAHAWLSPHSCGVSSPDASLGQAVLGPLASGGATNADYQIYIRVTAQGTDQVPETPTLVLVSAGLLMLRRRRAEASRLARWAP